MPNYDKTITLTELQLTTVGLNVLYPSNRVKVTSTLPAWFVDYTDVNDYSTYWEITPPLQGTFTYNVDVYFEDEPTLVGTGVITLNVADVYNEVDNCCSDENVNIVWFNRQGGWQNYIFTQRKNFGVEVGQAKTFINNGIVKYSDRGRVYNNKQVYAKGISLTEIDYLDTLRYGIQAYEFNPTTLEFKPILVDSNSFEKYNTKENMYEVVISYKYATQLDVQKQ